MRLPEEETTMRIHSFDMKTGISRSKEYEKKRLASYVVNTGVKCGHDCFYCSTGAVMRMHPAFKQVGENPFDTGYAIVDPETPNRVAEDARRRRHRGMVHMCSLVDAWAPEAQRYDLGRRCLEAVLLEPEWKVRILSKNTAVAKDFDLIRRYRDRVLFGLSITATPEKSNIMSILEPYASPNPDRMAVIRLAHDLGIRTYGMLCPLLPGVADGPDQVRELVAFAVDCGAEEIFAEPVNPRARCLIQCQEALAANGCQVEAAAIARVREKKHWSAYVVRLVCHVQQAVRELYDIERLRFLLYPSRLLPEHVSQIKRDDAGVIWLEKDRPTTNRQLPDCPRIGVPSGPER
jgi:DNA repair photolyase